MSRRRSISTDISTDPKLADLSAFGPWPVLLYTWAIPHADDLGKLTGDARQFKLLVCPAFDLTVQQVEDAIRQIESVGLWIRTNENGRLQIEFPLESWFKHQSYINKNKRESALIAKSAANHRKSPENTEEPQETAEITASPSPSPSPSKAAVDARVDEPARVIQSAEDCEEIDDAWQVETCRTKLVQDGYALPRVNAGIAKAKKNARQRGQPIASLLAYVRGMLESEDRKNAAPARAAPAAAPSGLPGIDAVRRMREASG